MTIEKFKGTVPRCRNCGKPLRPNYKTIKEPLGQATGRRKEWLDVDKGGFHPPEDPTKPCEDTHYSTTIYWSPRRQQWWRWVRVYKVTSRVFTGTFGCESLFCKPWCGYCWAVKKIREIEG